MDVESGLLDLLGPRFREGNPGALTTDPVRPTGLRASDVDANAVKVMPVDARGATFCADGPCTAFHPVMHVLGLGARDQVGDLYARGVVAGVPHDLTWPDRSTVGDPGQAVSEILDGPLRYPVPVRISGTIPLATPRRQKRPGVIRHALHRGQVRGRAASGRGGVAIPSPSRVVGSAVALGVHGLVAVVDRASHAQKYKDGVQWM